MTFRFRKRGLLSKFRGTKGTKGTKGTQTETRII